MIRCFAFFVFATLLISTQVGFVQAQENTASWKQWGGNDRNFALANPSQVDYRRAPEAIWTQKTGPGHSAVLVDGRVGYCQFLADESEALPGCSV